MSELKKEFKNFLDDLEKNIKNKEDLEYIKGRTAEFMDVVLDQMEYVLNYKIEKLSQIEKTQNELANKIDTIEQEIDEIEQDIYSEDEGIMENIEDSECDFEIICPYCDTEFFIDIDQENSEIECPQCNNIIELDWTGNLEDENQNSQEQELNNNTGCGSGHCSKCPGCNPKEDEDM